MNKKICPMLSRYIWRDTGYVENGLHEVECKKEKCAWWVEYCNPKNSCCALVDITNLKRN